MTRLTADTSVVVPSLTSWHEHHEVAAEAIREVRALPGHVLLEAASVLSRLPRGLAQPLPLIADLLGESFPDDPLVLDGEGHRGLLVALSRAGLRGGAVYDGLIAATVKEYDATLLSLDDRALPTYGALGVTVTRPRT